MAMIGINDADFIRGDVPMTKNEIRILTLAKANIMPKSVVWDIGAGTGSISIEAARLARDGHVYAVEKNPEGIRLIGLNTEKFGVSNITAVEAEAPAGLCQLPAPDTVIIGGSGRRIDDILDVTVSKLAAGGRIVINCITVQTISSCLYYLRAKKIDYEAIQVQVSRLERVGPYDMAKALNPVYITTCFFDGSLREINHADDSPREKGGSRDDGGWMK